MRVYISGWRARGVRDVPLRLVEIAPYEPLRLLTSRLDLSAELIGLLFKRRRHPLPNGRGSVLNKMQTA